MTADVASNAPLEAPEVTTAVVARSARHNAVGQVVNQSTRLLTSVVLARLLDPKDFGVVALALVMQAFLDEIKDVGMGATIVQRRTVDQVLLNSVFCANVVIGAAVSALLYASAAPLASALGNIDAAPAVQGFAAIMFVTSLGQIHVSLLRRNLQFGAIARVLSMMAVINALVSIGCALAGMTYWALVLGNAAAAVTGTTMYWVYDRWRPTAHASLAALRSVWRTSWHIFMVGFLTLIWVQVDKIIVSRFVGGFGLGVYTLGQRVVMTPTGAVSGMLSDVAYSAFARRQDDNAALRSGFMRSSAVIATITFPMMFGVAAVAGPLVPVVFGDKWTGLVPVIWCLAPACAFTSVTFNCDQILRAKQRSDWSWRWGVVHLVVLGGIELFMVRWGVVGVAAGYLIGTLLLMPFTIFMAFKPIQGRPIAYARALFPAVWMSTLMAAAALLVVTVLGRAGAHDAVQAGAGIVTGAAIYLGLLAALRPPALRDLLAVARPRTST
ncbi:lipopolysaccharide biosynthesis protein [Nocardioides dilutus]